MRILGRLVIVAVAALLMMSFFIVQQTENAMVFRFGEIVRTYEEDPGLKFKVPFLDNVRRYDNRILPLDTDEIEVTFRDNRRLRVDAFSRWRISDVRRYHVAVSNNGQQGARTLISNYVEDALYGVLGTVDTDAVLSENRLSLMRQVLQRVSPQAAQLGVEVVDVRIVRADLPESNLEAAINRMISEREQEAAFEIAQGTEAAARISANANRQKQEIQSSAVKDAQIIRGEADAERNRIFAEAYGQDPGFFDFYRSLQAYEKSLSGENTTMVLSPDDDFFRFLSNEEGSQ